MTGGRNLSLIDGGGGFWAWPHADRPALRQFGGIMAVALAGLTAWLWYRDSATAALSAAAAGSLFGLCGLVIPTALRVPFGLWMYLARILGWINTHVLLGIVFYSLFTLTGLVMRLFRYDPLQRRLETGRPTYWQRRTPSRSPREGFEHQF